MFTEVARDKLLTVGKIIDDALEALHSDIIIIARGCSPNYASDSDKCSEHLLLTYLRS
jgi:hypothetical protein